jgi:hypothetical protein
MVLDVKEGGDQKPLSVALIKVTTVKRAIGT